MKCIDCKMYDPVEGCYADNPGPEECEDVLLYYERNAWQESGKRFRKKKLVLGGMSMDIGMLMDVQTLSDWLGLRFQIHRNCIKTGIIWIK